MKITKSGYIFLMACIVPVLLQAQFVTLDPQNPQTGQELTFKVRPKQPDQMKSMRIILYKDLTGEPDTLSMELVTETWRVSTVITDSAVTALFFRITGTDFQNKPFILDDKGTLFRKLICDKNGRAVRGARLAEALLFGGFGGLQPENLSAAMQALDKELEHYPENYEARLYRYTLMMQEDGLTDPVAFAIQDDIEAVLDANKDRDALRFAIQGYRMIGLDEEAETIMQLLQKLDPSEDSRAIQRFNAIMAVEDITEQTLQLEDFIGKYPESRLHEAALSQLASSFIELNDSTALIETGNRLLLQASTMAGASGLSAIAGVLAEKKWQMETAQKYISRALGILAQTDPAEHPPEISDAEWQERIGYTQTRYEDISGWIFFQQGDYQKAIQILEKASENTMEPGILYHLAETVNALGQEEKAVGLYARVTAFGGAVGEMAREKLDTIWERSGRDPAQLESLLTLEEDQVQQAYEKKIRDRAQIRPLPKFTLERLSGGRISSSELRGEKALLCFWATWSDASAKLIDALIDIAYARDDVRVLGASVDRDGAEISRYVRDNRVPFQVLIVNKQTEQEFDLRGVPVLYVVDSNLRVHFIHKGFRPDIVDILNIELDSLE